MKKLFGAICFILMISTASAAEINFLDNPSWSSVLEKAKKENKIIFLDAYATWCGPCKKMDAETYKTQAVADFYNANFINVRYDMEKGEGPMLAEKFMVNAYPNLLFINTDGVLLHKGIGYQEANDFLDLGKSAKDPASQYYTLKKRALELSNPEFARFAIAAASFEDEDFDQISDQYLAKQPDILGNVFLIDLVMNDISSLPDEKSLAYINSNKEKIVATKKYTLPEVEERLISLTLGYALSPDVQTSAEELDFEAVKKLLDKYVPEKSFFVYHYFRTQYLLDNRKIDDAVAEFDILLSNTPAKVGFDQLCNAMMNIGYALAENGKLDAALTKFDAVVVPEKDKANSYMKDFVKAIIYIKSNQFDKFKTTANSLLANPTTPEKIKADIKVALEKIAAKP